MFGINPIEMVIILVVAIIVVGPDKLPDAARTIGKAIRGLRKETDQLRQTIEDDTDFGDAVRELRGALRGDYFDLDPPKPDKKSSPKLDQAAAKALEDESEGEPAASAAVKAEDAADPAMGPDQPADTARSENADPDLPEIKPAGEAPRDPKPAHG